MDDHIASPSPTAQNDGHQYGDGQVWSMIGTLVGGPLVWGGAGFGADALTGNSGLFTGLGILVGAATSLYIVYVRHGRG